jgi:hypothetical protein
MKMKEIFTSGHAFVFQFHFHLIMFLEDPILEQKGSIMYIIFLNI